jgi:hypothetical protein
VGRTPEIERLTDYRHPLDLSRRPGKFSAAALEIVCPQLRRFPHIECGLMSDQFDFLTDLAAQMSCAPNDDARDRRGGFYRPSPSILRAKPVRPPKGPPAAAASPREAIPEQQPPAPPVVHVVVTTENELLDLLRARRDALGLTHETIDHITGWAGGYASKVLSPEPLKRFGERSLGLLLQALALGIARIEFIEDPAQVARMSGRWTRRRRPKMRARRTRTQLRDSGALLTGEGQETLPSTSIEEGDNVEIPPEFPPKA